MFPTVQTLLIMKLKLLLIFQLYIAIVKPSPNDAKIEYYEQLINTTLKETQSYNLPTKNNEFEEGINSEEINNIGCYDYVVVGAGTAGSVLATRLSEIANFTVFVIEAGDEENDFTQIPSYQGALQNSKYNWGYISKPQTSCCQGMVDKRCAAPRGKAIGGTNTINGLVYTRGAPADYAAWAKRTLPMWAWPRVLPYFLKSENVQTRVDPAYHAAGGLWNVQHNGPNSPLARTFLDANVQSAQPFRTDANGRHSTGVFRFQVTEKYGQRLTTARAFLDTARLRPNVAVTTNSYATKIDIEPATKQATGVVFVKNGKKYRVKAKHQVLVSAGTYNSPQLLMLSGVGPKAELAKHGIDLVQDLPVGENLKEQPYFVGLRFITNQTEEFVSLSESIAKYLQGTGPLTISGNLENYGMLGEANRPLVEYIHQPHPNSVLPRFYNIFRYRPDIIEKYVPSTSFRQFLISPALMHEVSSGKVTLKSNNSVDFPEIDYNFFTDKSNSDVKRMIKAIRFIMKLQDAPAYRAINATFVPPPVCTERELYSDDYWECLLRNLTGVLYHPVGTCAMGINGVVNPWFSVRGIQNLKVVDASVIPVTISGHTNAVAAMLGERAADFIKEERLFKTQKCYNTYDGRVFN